MLLTLSLVVLSARGVGDAVPDQRINVVLGDASWTSPTPAVFADEVTRIQVHLRFVAARLASETDALLRSSAQLGRRKAGLDHLLRYADRGIFPRRTSDPYPGRRPRFVDDRGVNCAVGQLLVDSGAEALARSLAARFEYATVAEIDEPELLRWADANGFSVTDLAMIQPSYVPAPTLDGIHSSIVASKDHVTVQCLTHGRPPSAVTLDVRLDANGKATAVSRQKDPFSTCMAGFMARFPRGAMAGTPRVGGFKVTLQLTPAQVLFERAFDSALGSTDALISSCMPRPGNVARHAVIVASAARDGLEVSVRTTPENPEVERCLWEEVRAPLRAFNGSATRLSLKRSRHLVSQGASLDSVALAGIGERAATRCSAPTGVELKVGVVARSGAGEFQVFFEGLEDSRTDCMTSAMEKSLTQWFTIKRESGEALLIVDADLFLAANFRPPYPRLERSPMAR